MNREKFINRVVEVYFNNNCSVKEALDITRKEHNLDNTNFLNLYGKRNDDDEKNKTS